MKINIIQDKFNKPQSPLNLAQNFEHWYKVNFLENKNSIAKYPKIIN